MACRSSRGDCPFAQRKNHVSANHGCAEHKFPSFWDLVDIFLRRSRLCIACVCVSVRARMAKPQVAFGRHNRSPSSCYGAVVARGSSSLQRRHCARSHFVQRVGSDCPEGARTAVIMLFVYIHAFMGLIAILCLTKICTCQRI